MIFLLRLGPVQQGFRRPVQLTAPLRGNNCHTCKKIDLAHDAGLSGLHYLEGKVTRDGI
jgi:hypothetical protein